jgi:hypothetical protein
VKDFMDSVGLGGWVGEVCIVNFVLLIEVLEFRLFFLTWCLL